MPTWSLSDTVRIAFKVVLLGTFILALGAFSAWFVGFSNDVYLAIKGFADGAVSSSNLPDLLGCAISALGIDVFLTSAFSIFFSAGTFWLTAVGYILAYKLGFKAYDGVFKALS